MKSTGRLSHEILAWGKKGKEASLSATSYRVCVKGLSEAQWMSHIKQAKVIKYSIRRPSVHVPWQSAPGQYFPTTLVLDQFALGLLRHPWVDLSFWFSIHASGIIPQFIRRFHRGILEQTMCLLQPSWQVSLTALLAKRHHQRDWGLCTNKRKTVALMARGITIVHARLWKDGIREGLLPRVCIVPSNKIQRLQHNFPVYLRATVEMPYTLI